MRALSASEMLDVWERGPAQNPVQRALSLLSAANPDTPTQDLAQICVGQRNALLLTLREWMFGPVMVGVTECPNCRERLELNFSVSDIRAAPMADPPERLQLSAAGYDVEFRLPNSLDLLAVLEHADVGLAQEKLLRQCVISLRFRGEDAQVEHLPAEIVDMIAARMDEADPQADVRLLMSCPECGSKCSAAFDSALYIWSEINAWAHRTLRDIHALASAYGWREADILAMNSRRRQVYLNLIGA